MILSVSKKFLFIHIPKTGGLSIEVMLRSFDEKAGKNLKNRNARRLNLALPAKDALFGRHDSIRRFSTLCNDTDPKELHSFAIVRNPYDHAVSHYNFLKQLPWRRHGDLARRLSFTQYLEVRANPTLSMSRALRKDFWFFALPDQTSFVCDAAGKILVNDVLMFENLNEHWSQTSEKIGILNIPLQHRNKGHKRSQRPYDDYLDETSRRLIHSIYARDFRNFGYPM